MLKLSGSRNFLYEMAFHGLWVTSTQVGMPEVKKKYLHPFQVIILSRMPSIISRLVFPRENDQPPDC